jgi:hypothetical protein
MGRSRGVQLTLMSAHMSVSVIGAHMSVSEDTAHAHVSASKERERELYTPRAKNLNLSSTCLKILLADE